MPETQNSQLIQERQIDVIVREPQVLQMIGGVDHSTLVRWAAAGLFPPPLRLGLRTRGWRLSTIQEWIASRTPANSTSAAD